jgi:sulfite reductase beta subunit-like hemoprotein
MTVTDELFSILFNDCAKLRDVIAAQDTELLALREQNEFHPRAAKLMSKRKGFVVVAQDESYYPVVYAMIRNHEIKSGRWNDIDEIAYRQSIGLPPLPSATEKEE